MKIGTRITSYAYNYDTSHWDLEIWEYYDEHTGEPVPAHIAERPVDHDDAPSETS
jgi:hypothetical protein